MSEAKIHITNANAAWSICVAPKIVKNGFWEQRGEEE